ncbi:hypothetical protein TIFTF001_035047 [Ficus carica]|uniref:Uncharacterized protein n=1 Tax=Ficus carica TaxID=3494 RepID=A0AA88J9L3_FICCA|nr:hypothetical protein TIFTF001_035047 [Ficus carica]
MSRSLSLMDGQLIVYDGVGGPAILNGKALRKWKKVVIMLVFTLEILTQESRSLESKSVDSTNLKVEGNNARIHSRDSHSREPLCGVEISGSC